MYNITSVIVPSQSRTIGYSQTNKYSRFHQRTRSWKRRLQGWWRTWWTQLLAVSRPRKVRSFLPNLFYTFLTLDLGEGVEVSKLYALSNFAAFASYHVFDCYLRCEPKNLTSNAPKFSICAVACLIVVINTHCNRTKLCDNIHQLPCKASSERYFGRPFGS